MSVLTESTTALLRRSTRPASRSPRPARARCICVGCGFAFSIAAIESLPECPNCGGRSFRRASLFDRPTVDTVAVEVRRGGRRSGCSRPARSSSGPATTSPSRRGRRVRGDPARVGLDADRSQRRRRRPPRRPDRLAAPRPRSCSPRTATCGRSTTAASTACSSTAAGRVGAARRRRRARDRPLPRSTVPRRRERTLDRRRGRAWSCRPRACPRHPALDRAVLRDGGRLRRAPPASRSSLALRAEHRESAGDYSVEMFGSAWTLCGTIIRKFSGAAAASAIMRSASAS